MVNIKEPLLFKVKRKAICQDPNARNITFKIEAFLNKKISHVEIEKLYRIDYPLSSEIESLLSGILSDPLFEEMHCEKEISFSLPWVIEVSFKKGVTDNTASIIETAIEDVIGKPLKQKRFVTTAKRYLIDAQLSQKDIEEITENLLANTLIEDIKIYSNKTKVNECLSLLEDPEEKKLQDNQVIDLSGTDEELLRISKERQLALNLNEMRVIRDYFQQSSTKKNREEVGLTTHPTELEIEAIAQTWSEHCKHKIFQADITYSDGNTKQKIVSLFDTYVKKATENIGRKINWLASVFHDNAGLIRVNEDFLIAFKVETHNSPSALDPYGGALTGILGVNRDIMGAGMGARMIANTDIFCFAPMEDSIPRPKKLLHPKRIFEGVRRGVESGGNKMGIPTVNGALVFDVSYLAKPLVYCGTVGILPARIKNRPSETKEIKAGDYIVVAGGRTGKDGIRGATFSSQELHQLSPQSVVQIGDPFTQKKLADFLLEARNRGLYRCVTDNGAGGFSSSVGELARLSGGCKVYLDRAPLKYEGLKSWEVFLSESQERMTLAVPEDKWEDLIDLSLIHEVEVSCLGEFTQTGYLHVVNHEKSVGYIDLEFFHNGVPTLQLDAEWVEPKIDKWVMKESQSYEEDLFSLLSSDNICSRECIIRQYDHEVQGGSAVKPLVGIHSDGPSDAAVIRPLEFLEHPHYHNQGIAISNGICPKFSRIDTYHMAANAIDEAIRNCIAVGGNPEMLAILDNFCWPDPIFDVDKTIDGKYKLAQLVRACMALYEYAVCFGVPIISGKDSMKNDYKSSDVNLSIVPTLLISAISKVDDIRNVVTMDVKMPGDLIYVLGFTKNELGCSEYATLKKTQSGQVPVVDGKAARLLYESLYHAIKAGIVASCHDCSDGGLGVALAESAFSGGFGISVAIEKVPREKGLKVWQTLFSESASRFVVTVAPDNKNAFEKMLSGSFFAHIGEVREDDRFEINQWIQTDIHTLKSCWKRKW